MRLAISEGPVVPGARGRRKTATLLVKLSKASPQTALVRMHAW